MFSYFEAFPMKQKSMRIYIYIYIIWLQDDDAPKRGKLFVNLQGPGCCYLHREYSFVLLTQGSLLVAAALRIMNRFICCVPLMFS